MSSVEKGTKVRVVLKEGSPFHQFDEGEVVTSTGADLSDRPTGSTALYNTYAEFEDEGGFTQWLLPFQYEVLKEESVALLPSKERLETPLKGVDSDLPTKVVYVVTKDQADIIATTWDRDFARELKSAMGGKAKGVKIFQYVASKEIR